MRSDALAQTLSLDQVNEIVRRWDVGLVKEIATMSGGSRTNSKSRVVCEGGTFVLKRRQSHATDIERVRFAHQVMLTAGNAGLPIALVQVARDQSTFQVCEGGIYELFLFLSGERWRRLPNQAREAGRALATLHHAALNMPWHGNVKASCFHGNLIVVEALRRVPAAVLAQQPHAAQSPLMDLCQQLSNLYQHASEQVDDLGYDQLDSQVVHGDWHPGNILFDGERVSGVLDFDSARLVPAIADVANGLLQYSVRAGPSRAIDNWPHELDEALLLGFARGIASVNSGALLKLVRMVPWLMIEACIAEASIPIAKSGMFAIIPGDKMLALILRRALWIQSNAVNLARIILSDCTP